MFSSNVSGHAMPIQRATNPLAHVWLSICLRLANIHADGLDAYKVREGHVSTTKAQGTFTDHNGQQYRITVEKVENA